MDNSSVNLGTRLSKKNAPEAGVLSNLEAVSHFNGEFLSVIKSAITHHYCGVTQMP